MHGSAAHHICHGASAILSILPTAAKHDGATRTTNGSGFGTTVLPCLLPANSSRLYLDETIADILSKMQGRSPYDEVVWPNGDPDDSGSDVDSSDSESANGSQRQQYDHKGRPVNPATKTLNREIVRAHNEVMHVIGVAEPDILNNEAEMQSARRYLAYEQKVGDQMEYLGKGLMEVGIWAFTGLRHRVMVCIRALILPRNAKMGLISSS